MTALSIEYKVGDAMPALAATLTDGARVPIDLTEALSVGFRLERPDGTRESRIAELVDAAAGAVSYQWEAGDITGPGTYLVEWVVTFPEGPRTFPSRGQVRIRVEESLA